MPPSSGGNPTAASLPQPIPSIGSFQINLNPPTSNGILQNYPPHIPLSLRRAPPLDLSTVERRGQPSAARDANKRTRPHGLQEAPTFRPTAEEFGDPMEYIRKIYPEGEKYGICKVIPPDSWNPSFSIDTEVRSSSPENQCFQGRDQPRSQKRSLRWVIANVQLAILLQNAPSGAEFGRRR